MITRREALRVSSWSLLGAVVGRAGVAARPREARHAGLWVADRGHHRLLRLDADGIVLGRVELPAPVAVAPASGGGAWVACALEAVPCGPHALLRLGRDGAVLERRPSAPVRALVADGAGRVWTLDARWGDRAPGVVEHAGAARDPRTRDVSASGAAAIAVGAPGRLWWRGRDGHIAGPGPGGAALLPGSEHARAPRSAELAADAVGAWTLFCRDEGGALVARLFAGSSGPRLAALVRVEVGALATEGGVLAPDGRGGAWLVECGGRGALRLDAALRVVTRVESLPCQGVDAVLATGDGGAWLAAGGALLRLDGRGRLRPGQGRCGWLAALASAGAEP